MIPNKKPYVKPQITTISTGTPKYFEIIAKLNVQDDSKKESVTGSKAK